jgi:hypothetical protein
MSFVFAQLYIGRPLASIRGRPYSCFPDSAFKRSSLSHCLSCLDQLPIIHVGQLMSASQCRDTD